MNFKLTSYPVDESEDMDAEDYPYCMCDEQPMEEEEASNVCSCCGKPLT